MTRNHGTRIGSFVLSGDSMWVTEVSSCVPVSVVDLKLIIEKAELAHASVWIPCEPSNQDMDAQLAQVPARHVDKRTRTHPTTAHRQQPSGVQAFRDLARRHNPRSQARSLAQLQGVMHFFPGRRMNKTHSRQTINYLAHSRTQTGFAELALHIVRLRGPVHLHPVPL